MSTGDGFGPRCGRNGEFCVAVNPVIILAANSCNDYRRWLLISAGNPTDMGCILA